MNSLVVFLVALVGLAAAKPAFLTSGIVGYAAPAVAIAPAAVSHQSRIDIKSSPAIVATETVAPLSRAVIAEPAIVAAPAAYAAHVAYAAAPATIGVPAAYAAPLAYAAPAAVSSQSRIDIKSSPGIINTVVASPIAYSSPVVATYASSLYSPAIVPFVRSAAIEPAASIDTGALPVAPTETPEVAAARAAHHEALGKALEEEDNIQKRL